jgi:hypothetical protein
VTTEAGRRFTFRGDGGDRLTVEIVGYLAPEPESPIDADWLRCSVEVSAGAFQGAFPALLRVDELEGLYAIIDRLYDDLRGNDSWHTAEGQIELDLGGDGLGHITVRARCSDVAASDNRLMLTLTLDQTLLFGTRVELAEVLARYPSRAGG